MNAAHGAAAAGTLFPQQPAVIGRIKGVDHAGFLAHQQDFPAMLVTGQNRSGSDVIVWTVLFRAIRRTPGTGTVPGIVPG